MGVAHLIKAKEAKDDEFYTPESAVHFIIDETLRASPSAYEGRSVFCPCDDPLSSFFPRVLHDRFRELGLSRLVSTGFPLDGHAPLLLDYDGSRDYGDSLAPLPAPLPYQSHESTAIMQGCDLVMTNPPFSPLVSSFLPRLHLFGIDYQLLVPLTAVDRFWPRVAASEVFARRLYGDYRRPDGSTVRLGNVCMMSTAWFSPAPPRPPLPLPPLSSLPPVDVDPVHGFLMVPDLKSIPGDYDGGMLVPLTYLMFHDPSRFDLLSGSVKLDGRRDYVSTFSRCVIRRVSGSPLS